VDDVNITADFSAQDTNEANYVLAVIHFFKSVTKMFYGQDSKNQGSPRSGTPPPLCYLTGLGQSQFDNHPLVITNFQYNLPNDVDYIRAGSTTQFAGVNFSAFKPRNTAPSGLVNTIKDRLFGSNLSGEINKQPKFNTYANSKATYVPTKMQITLTCHPVVTRKDISQNFSVADYATGKLLQGSVRKGGGIW
jgi:hypothetical protein